MRPRYCKRCGCKLNHYNRSDKCNPCHTEEAKERLAKRANVGCDK